VIEPAVLPPTLRRFSIAGEPSAQAASGGIDAVIPPTDGTPPPAARTLRAVSDARFAVRRRQLSDSVRIEVEGELDVATLPPLAGEFAWAAAVGAPLVVVDLAAVTLVDSTSLLLLVRTTLQLRAQGSELVVRPPQGPARRVFDLVGADRPLLLPEDAGEQRFSAVLKALREENAHLQRALTSRIVIEQAKGILAERLGIGVDAAFERLRRTARNRRQRIHDLAAAVVAGSEEAQTLFCR
jgi:anti-anti-sigma factor